MVLAAGGGSCMDAGKFIAAGACVDFDPWDFISKQLPLKKALPILTIPTMAATGSEMNPTVVISNMETRQKLGCSSPALRPKVSFLDPELTVSVSRYQTACGSADILSHIMETYFNPGEGMFLLDSVMEGLMKTVLKYAPIALEHPDDYEARANLMWASTWAINGFTRTCQNHVWACHGLEHELSAFYDITHGLGLAIVTPRFLEYCLNESNVSRYVRFGVNVFGLDPRQEPMTIAQQSIRKLADFFYKDLGLTSTLTELGIRKEDFPLMAQKGLRSQGRRNQRFQDPAPAEYHQDLRNVLVKQPLPTREVPMDTNNLRYFAAVAQYGSITRAAKAMYISQPQLSHIIKQLEREMGMTLFRRTSQGTCLTMDGQRILSHCRIILQELDQLQNLTSSRKQDLRLPKCEHDPVFPHRPVLQRNLPPVPGRGSFFQSPV